jgi:GH15 family glucan-1,4-alpha-glucosidase
MMKQVKKVEAFKKTQALNECLHAKYNTQTGDTVVGDNQWGHLQLDATSIFLLCLAQMTASGLHVIYTLDEVQFIQNLVFYIERGYRTPDYGIWERGNKCNHGQPELNCSSIGMVLAALQAINGINLFGARGGPSSVIHVLPDEILRNHTTLHTALPRESASKEIDAALLSVISFPAFAVIDSNIIEKTRSEIIKKLAGKYGCKRFLRDGHQTVLEDHNRLHYLPHELKVFENVESEWPLFFTYLILDGLFNGDREQVKKYQKLLKPLLVNYPNNEIESLQLVPELYIVPAEKIEAEKNDPGSQERVPNSNVPLVWAQSLYILGELIDENLLSVADIDPLGLRMRARNHRNHGDTVVQIALIAESVELQAKLLMYGLETQTIENCEPITISKPSCLKHAYSFLGANQKLGLSGR